MDTVNRDWKLHKWDLRNDSGYRTSWVEAKVNTPPFPMGRSTVKRPRFSEIHSAT